MGSTPAMTDEAREFSSLQAWIEEALGLEVSSLEPIPAGLGLRRFFRVRLDGPPGVLIARVEASEDPAGRPEGVPPEPPQEPLRALLAKHGLPVPRRYAGNDTIELLEDFGDVTLEQAAQASSVPAPDPAGSGRTRRQQLYEQVLADVATLQRISGAAGVAAFDRHLSPALFAYKADLFARWSLPLVLGRPAEEKEAEEVGRAFAWISATCSDATQRLAHRDLQSRNLLVRNDTVHWIDFQGAFLAPPEYDPVCLLCDSYVELTEGEREALIRTAAEILPGTASEEQFRRRFDLLTLTRKGKDHARFQYAETERGDTTQRAYLPATSRALKRAAAAARVVAPELHTLCDWMMALPEADAR